MKVFIEKDENYLLLTDEINKDNFENEFLKEEMINNAMDSLEQLKMAMEIERENKKNKVKMLKLGVHPSMAKRFSGK